MFVLGARNGILRSVGCHKVRDVYNHVFYSQFSGGEANDELAQLLAVILKGALRCAPKEENNLHNFSFERSGLQSESDGWLVVELSAVPLKTTPNPWAIPTVRSTRLLRPHRGTKTCVSGFIPARSHEHQAHLGRALRPQTRNLQ